MRMKLWKSNVAIALALLSGCSTRTLPPPPPSTPPDSIQEPPAKPATGPTFLMADAIETEPFPLEYDAIALAYSYPYESLAEAITSDQPTFKRGPVPERYVLGIESREGPSTPPADLTGTLQQIVDHLQSGTKPEEAGGPEATFIVTLAGDIHVYSLGKESPWDVWTDQLLFSLSHGSQGGVATRLCQHRSQHVGLYYLMSGEPLLFCDSAKGQGRPHWYVSIYRGAQEILHIDRLEAQPGGFELLPTEQDGPPTLRVIHYNDWFGRGRTSDYIMERVTLTWDGSQYIASRKEWQDDWAYHFARFDYWVGTGDLERAAGELAFTPEGGLQAYLEAHASGMAKNSHNWAWPRWKRDSRRFYVMGLPETHDVKTAPWYWFDFTPEGLIAGIGQQFTPPPE